MTCTETAFARQFKRAGMQNILRQFGEDVTYYAGGTGTGRSIKAAVDRGTIEAISDAGVAGQAITIRVRNHAKHGISSTEINTADDEIAVSLRVGATAQRRSIARVLADANGRLVLLMN